MPSMCSGPESLPYPYLDMAAPMNHQATEKKQFGEVHRNSTLVHSSEVFE